MTIKLDSSTDSQTKIAKIKEICDVGSNNANWKSCWNGVDAKRIGCPPYKTAGARVSAPVSRHIPIGILAQEAKEAKGKDWQQLPC